MLRSWGKVEKYIKKILDELESICKETFYRRADSRDGVYVTFNTVDLKGDRNRKDWSVDISVWGDLDDSVEVERISGLVVSKYTDYLDLCDNSVIYSFRPRLRNLDEDMKLRNLISVDFKIY